MQSLGKVRSSKKVPEQGPTKVIVPLIFKCGVWKSSKFQKKSIARFEKSYSSPNFQIWNLGKVPSSKKVPESKVQEKLEFPKFSNVEFGKSSKFQRSSRARFDKVRVNVEFGKSSNSHRIPQEGLNKCLKSSKVELQSLSKVSVPNNFHRKFH